MWNSADATITGFAYQPDNVPAIAGLDYDLHAESMAGFSDLGFSQLGLGIGANYRVTSQLVINGLVNYGRYDEDQPYIIDATGSFVQFFGGVSWVF
jgi:hypothetical protein